MYNELTEVDIKKMQEELEYRDITLRAELIKNLKEAREFGDLSENAEYHLAKREKGRNESRIRYLKNMINTAKIITTNSNPNVVGIFDKVKVYFPDDDEEEVYTLSTTTRRNPDENIISKESPLGKALMGHSVGDKILVKVSDDVSYYVEIKEITKGKDDDSLPITKF